MADWFEKLMRGGRARARPETALTRVSTHEHGGGTIPNARPARFDAIVQRLSDREPVEREAREKRQRWYRQSLPTDVAAACAAPTQSSPIRLHRLGAKVPCRATPEARVLIEQLTRRFPGCTVTFPVLSADRQAVMLTGGAGTERRQIGWLESRAETDPKLCNVRNLGLSVETDGDEMLVLRFRYPATAVAVSRKQLDATENVASVDFTELRPALDSRAADRARTPRLVWLTRPERETMNAMASRDYETFYVRFKVELQAAIWSSLLGLLASSGESRCHRGAYYTVVREADAAVRKIVQHTIDDTGRRLDIGLDMTYDAAAATDILLLSLDGDILADLADIYFTLESVGSADAYFLKEEFFAVNRRFWAGAQSLTSCYGSDVAAVLRMAQRVVPMPAQAALLKQDWANLRQIVLDRYGARGRKAAELLGRDLYRTRSGLSGWPFASYPVGEVNVGLHIVYRQEWKHLGVERGNVLRTIPAAAAEAASEMRREAIRRERVETTIQPGDATRSVDAMARELAAAAACAMNWPADLEGSIQIGARGLAARTELGVEADCRESSHEICGRLSEQMLKMATARRDDRQPDSDVLAAVAVDDLPDGDEATRVYSRLLNRYEVRTRPNEIRNVVLVAEKLPSPAEIDASWVRRNDWILSAVLLDESFREAIAGIAAEDGGADGREMRAQRERLYEHLRANILHYQRAIWAREDPQQRSMRYRKLGKKVPLEWRFELEAGAALTLEDLGDRLTAANVDAQFAAYSPGREVDLEQLIDPAGPIGYYANYAIYRMRPEFARAELFSMLHFFKSPYLQPHPETGPPVIEDEVVRPARHIVLETNGVIVDVIRPVAGCCDRERDCVEAIEDRLLLENTDQMQLLCASGSRWGTSSWELLHCSEASRLLAGQSEASDESPALLAQEDVEKLTATSRIISASRSNEGAILAEADVQRMQTLRVGTPTSEGEASALAAAGELTLGRRTAEGAANDDQIVHSELARVFIGRARDMNERVILGSSEVESRQLVVGTVRVATPVTEAAIVTAAGGVLRPGAFGDGAVGHDRPVIHISNEGEWTPRLRVGAGAGRARDLVVLVHDDEWLRPSLVAS